MTNLSQLKVAVLVDLPRSPQAGGHVKGWERLAQAAARYDLPLDLTVFFSGNPLTEKLAEHVTLRQLPPVFSTARLKFLPYVPDHTDLAPYHPALARELPRYDVVHTTDAFFAFTRTAEFHRRRRALTHSFHTDQVNYARIFAAKSIRERLGDSQLARWLLEKWQLPERISRRMERKLLRHVHRCGAVVVTRASDRMFAEQILGPHGVRTMRLGTDKELFNPRQANRALMQQRYLIPSGRIVLVFVGRLDEGKNIYTLLTAMRQAIDANIPLHLVAAGVGPAADDIRAMLGDHASIPGFVPPGELAQLYASADALALSSEVETRSQAMVEALASGLPVLVAAKSGVHKLLPSSPALQVVSGGTDSWTSALHDFASTSRPKLQAAAVEIGRKYIASWEEILAEDLLPAWQQAARMKIIRS